MLSLNHENLRYLIGQNLFISTDYSFFRREKALNVLLAILSSFSGALRKTFTVVIFPRHVPSL